MKYVMAFTGRRGPTQLDEGSTRSSVSDECREAALAFMAGVAGGWDKLDLALWLTGPYARATRHALRGERVTGILGAADVEETTLEELLTRTRGQILAALEHAVLQGGTLELAEHAVEADLVRKATTVDGDVAFVPVDGPRMRLKDRVASLFAADFLNDAEAYVDLYVCHRCEAVVFDPDAQRRGACAAHRRVSGVVPREGAPADADTKASGDR